MKLISAIRLICKYPILTSSPILWLICWITPMNQHFCTRSLMDTYPQARVTKNFCGFESIPRGPWFLGSRWSGRLSQITYLELVVFFITLIISKLHPWGKPSEIFFPAPLRYQYDKKEWWSIYSNTTYDRLIPWYRRLKHWPLFPSLLDNIIITARKGPSVRLLYI